MKKILTIIGLATVATLAFSQGTLTFENTGTAFGNYTNLTPSTTVGGPGATGTGGFGGGLTTASTTDPNAYFYTLLIAATTGTAPSDNPLGPAWSQAMLYTNSADALMANNFVTAGSMEGPNIQNATEINGFAGGTSIYIMLVGWSANIGATWSSVETALEDGWQNNYDYASLNGNHFFGFTSVGEITLGSPSPGVPASLFGGTGLSGGVTMDWVGPTPEPTTLALTGLGSLSLLVLRRRKSQDGAGEASGKTHF